MNEKCFALQRNGKCRAVVGNCPGYGSCVFYKPRWKFEKEQRLALMKLSALPAEKQTIIADKYYGGKMLWEAIKE